MNIWITLKYICILLLYKFRFVSPSLFWKDLEGLGDEINYEDNSEKLVVFDDLTIITQDGSGYKENDITKYYLEEDGYVVGYKFRDEAKCVEVRQDDWLFWKYGNDFLGNFPIRLLFNFNSKMMLVDYIDKWSYCYKHNNKYDLNIPVSSTQVSLSDIKVVTYDGHINHENNPFHYYKRINGNLVVYIFNDSKCVQLLHNNNVLWSKDNEQFPEYPKSITLNIHSKMVMVDFSDQWSHFSKFNHSTLIGFNNSDNIVNTLNSNNSVFYKDFFNTFDNSHHNINQYSSGVFGSFTKSDISIFTYTDSGFVENDHEAYDLIQYDFVYEYKFKNNAKCTQVKHKNTIIWEHNQEESGNNYPKSLYLNFYAKIILIDLHNDWSIFYKFKQTTTLEQSEIISDSIIPELEQQQKLEDLETTSEDSETIPDPVASVKEDSDTMFEISDGESDISDLISEPSVPEEAEEIEPQFMSSLEQMEIYISPRPSQKQLISLDIKVKSNSYYDFYNNSIRRSVVFIPKEGYFFNKLNEGESHIWSGSSLFCEMVSIEDFNSPEKKLVLHFLDGTKKVFYKWNSRDRWVERVSGFQQGRFSDIKIITEDDSGFKENDYSKYDLEDLGQVTCYKFKKGVKSVEFLYKNERLWKFYDSDKEYPKAFYFHKDLLILFVEYPNYFFFKNQKIKFMSMINPYNLSSSDFKIVTASKGVYKENDTSQYKLEKKVGFLRVISIYTFKKGSKCVKITYKNSTVFVHHRREFGDDYPEKVILHFNSKLMVVTMPRFYLLYLYSDNKWLQVFNCRRQRDTNNHNNVPLSDENLGIFSDLEGDMNLSNNPLGDDGAHKDSSSQKLRESLLEKSGDNGSKTTNDTSSEDSTETSSETTSDSGLGSELDFDSQIQDKNFVLMDISVTEHKSYGCFISSDKKSKVFLPKYGYLFGSVSESGEKIWESFSLSHLMDSQYYFPDQLVNTYYDFATRVNMTSIDSEKNLEIHLLNGEINKYRKIGTQKWEEKKFCELDITVQRSTSDSLYSLKRDMVTYFPRGYPFRSVKEGDKLLWEAKNPEEYCSKVILDGISSESKHLSLFLKNGKSKNFYKSEKFRPWVEQVYDIPVTEHPPFVTIVTEGGSFGLSENDTTKYEVNKLILDKSPDLSPEDKSYLDYDKEQLGPFKHHSKFEMSESLEGDKRFSYEYKFKKEGRCVEFKYKNQTVWKKSDTPIKEYPNKIFLNLKNETVWIVFLNRLHYAYEFVNGKWSNYFEHRDKEFKTDSPIVSSEKLGLRDSDQDFYSEKEKIIQEQLEKDKRDQDQFRAINILPFIKVFTKQGSIIKENDFTKYEQSSLGFVGSYIFPKNSECVELRYKDEIIWKSDSDNSSPKTPLTLYFNLYAKVALASFDGFDSFYNFRDKMSFGHKVDVSEFSASDLIIVTSDGSIFKENCPDHLDVKTFYFKKEYSFKAGAKCFQIMYKGEKVWTHHPEELGMTFPEKVFVNSFTKMFSLEFTDFSMAYEFKSGNFKLVSKNNLNTLPESSLGIFTNVSSTNFGRSPENLGYEKTSIFYSYYYEFNEGIKCLHIKYKNSLVWAHDSEKFGNQYPEKVFFNVKNKTITLKFLDSYMIYSFMRGRWVLGTTTSLDCFSERKFTVITLEGNLLMENRESSYGLTSLGLRHEYIFKKGVKCVQIKYKGEPVWKHGLEDFGDVYPEKILINLYNKMVTIHFPSFYVIYEFVENAFKEVNRKSSDGVFDSDILVVTEKCMEFSKKDYLREFRGYLLGYKFKTTCKCLEIKYKGKMVWDHRTNPWKPPRSLYLNLRNKTVMLEFSDSLIFFYKFLEGRLRLVYIKCNDLINLNLDSNESSEYFNLEGDDKFRTFRAEEAVFFKEVKGVWKANDKSEYSTKVEVKTKNNKKYITIHTITGKIRNFQKQNRGLLSNDPWVEIPESYST